MNGDNSNVVVNGGVGFFGLLQIVFLTLDCAGIIEWSWIWVWAPTWIPIVALVLLTIIYFVVFAIALKRRGKRWE